MVSIKERLETVRLTLSINWQDLASEIGVSRQFLTMVKNGKRCLGAESMLKLKKIENSLNLVYTGNNPIDELADGSRMFPLQNINDISEIKELKTALTKAQNDLASAQIVIKMQAETVRNMSEYFTQILKVNSVAGLASIVSNGSCGISRDNNKKGS